MKIIQLVAIALCVTVAPVRGQTPLSSDQVEHFLNSLDRLGALTDPSEDEEMEEEAWSSVMDIDPEELKEKMTSPFTSSIEGIQQHESYVEGLAIIKSEGFHDEYEWAGIGDRVIRAYTALKMEGVDPEMDAQMAEAMKNLEESDLPDDMKKKMREAMVVSRGMVDTISEVPEDDIEAVKPFLSRFEEMAGRSGEQ